MKKKCRLSLSSLTCPSTLFVTRCQLNCFVLISSYLFCFVYERRFPRFWGEHGPSVSCYPLTLVHVSLRYRVRSWPTWRLWTRTTSPSLRWAARPRWARRPWRSSTTGAARSASDTRSAPPVRRDLFRRNLFDVFRRNRTVDSTGFSVLLCILGISGRMEHPLLRCHFYKEVALCLVSA